MTDKKKKILIIDDDKPFLEELGELLQLSGYDLVIVEDERRALDTVRQTRPSLILLDLKMPNKSGFQVADEIRHLPESSATPIIAMSAYYKDYYKGLLETCGIRRCLNKPFLPLDIITEIEEALKEGERR